MNYKDKVCAVGNAIMLRDQLRKVITEAEAEIPDGMELSDGSLMIPVGAVVSMLKAISEIIQVVDYSDMVANADVIDYVAAIKTEHEHCESCAEDTTAHDFTVVAEVMAAIIDRMRSGTAPVMPTDAFIGPKSDKLH